MTTRIVSKRQPSTSAAICASAVSLPQPGDVMPVRIVTSPEGAIRTVAPS